jgi:hypothetical protein
VLPPHTLSAYTMERVKLDQKRIICVNPESTFVVKKEAANNETVGKVSECEDSGDLQLETQAPITSVQADLQKLEVDKEPSENVEKEPAAVDVESNAQKKEDASAGSSESQGVVGLETQPSLPKPSSHILNKNGAHAEEVETADDRKVSAGDDSEPYESSFDKANMTPMDAQDNDKEDTSPDEDDDEGERELDDDVVISSSAEKDEVPPKPKVPRNSGWKTMLVKKG